MICFLRRRSLTEGCARLCCLSDLLLTVMDLQFYKMFLIYPLCRRQFNYDITLLAVMHFLMEECEIVVREFFHLPQYATLKKIVFSVLLENGWIIFSLFQPTLMCLFFCCCSKCSLFSTKEYCLLSQYAFS